MRATKPVREADAGSQAIRVIYILGSGRSGSTVLDSVLGNHPDILSIGELSGLLDAVWVNKEYCACGELSSRCPFWRSVFSDWIARNKPERETTHAVNEYLALQQKFERLGFRQLGRSAWERLRYSPQFEKYLKQTAHLYESICQVSGQRIVVDSSKNPLRAELLSCVPGLDLRIIHLVRDGRAVAWSVKKSLPQNKRAGVPRTLRSRPAWRTICYWGFVNLLAERVKRLRQQNSILIRYEDFVAHPAVSLDSIARLIDVDLTEVGRAAASGESMQVGHTIAGNRLRMAGSVGIRPDWEWMRNLPRRDRSLCWLVAGWLLRRYGYPRRITDQVPNTPGEMAQRPLTVPGVDKKAG